MHHVSPIYKYRKKNTRISIEEEEDEEEEEAQIGFRWWMDGSFNFLLQLYMFLRYFS